MITSTNTIRARFTACMLRYAIAGLAFLAGSAVTARSAEKKEPPTVNSVTFEGNHAFKDGKLYDLMSMRPSSLFHSVVFHQNVFTADLQNIENFYHANGYLQARILSNSVKTDTVDNEVNIRIEIAEGAETKIDRFTMYGNKVFRSEILLDMVKLKPGDGFKRQPIIDGMLGMLTMYADSGYLHANVNPQVTVDSGAHLASINFQVTEGEQSRVGAIEISGLKKTQEYIVRRELLFHEGEVIHYSDLLKTQRRLYMLGLFDAVFIRPDTAGEATSRTIVVDLREKLSGDFNFGLSYASVEKLRGQVQLQTSNFMGTGRQLGTTVTADFIRQTFEGVFSEPWTLGTRFRTDVNALYELQQEPSFDLIRYGGRVTVGRELGLRSNVSVMYRFENVKFTKIRTFVIPDTLNPRVRSLTLTYREDERDNPFNSTDGQYLEVNAEHAGGFLSGTNTFARVTLRVKYFYPFDTETVLGTSLDIGWVNSLGTSPDVPLSERFFAGGPNSIRGFDYERIGPLDEQNRPLGGKVKLIWNLAELRRAVWKFFGVVGFIDMGQVWGQPEDAKFKDMRIAVGPGLRFNSPLGILRLDYGFNIFPKTGEAKGQLFFSMGQAF